MTRWRCWPSWRARARRPGTMWRPMRWGCWGWSPGRAGSRPGEATGRTDGRCQITRKFARDRVISTVDTRARHTRKCKSKRRDGSRGHVAAEPDTGLITDCEMTMATGPGSTDAENGVKMAARDRFRNAGDGAGPEPEAGTSADAGQEQKQGAG